MPLEAGEWVETIAGVTDEVQQVEASSLDAQVQEPINVKSEGEEVAHVAEMERLNVKVLE